MIVSLLLSAVMLGVKATSLNAIIRTICRKQELGMLIEELKKVHGNIPSELMEHARRATEHVPPSGIVMVWRPRPLGPG